MTNKQTKTNQKIGSVLPNLSHISYISPFQYRSTVQSTYSSPYFQVGENTYIHTGAGWFLHTARFCSSQGAGCYNFVILKAYKNFNGFRSQFLWCCLRYYYQPGGAFFVCDRCEGFSEITISAALATDRREYWPAAQEVLAAQEERDKFMSKGATPRSLKCASNTQLLAQDRTVPGLTKCRMFSRSSGFFFSNDNLLFQTNYLLISLHPFSAIDLLIISCQKTL